MARLLAKASDCTSHDPFVAQSIAIEYLVSFNGAVAELDQSPLGFRL
jgi:hypothetical protein